MWIHYSLTSIYQYSLHTAIQGGLLAKGLPALGIIIKRKIWWASPNGIFPFVPNSCMIDGPSTISHQLLLGKSSVSTFCYCGVTCRDNACRRWGWEPFWRWPRVVKFDQCDVVMCRLFLAQEWWLYRNTHKGTKQQQQNHMPRLSGLT